MPPQNKGTSPTLITVESVSGALQMLWDWLSSEGAAAVDADDKASTAKRHDEDNCEPESGETIETEGEGVP